MHPNDGMRSPLIAVLLAALAMLVVRADSAPLATGDRYGHMHMTLEKTWFDVDVADVDVWFNQTTADRIRQLATGQRYSNDVAERIARTVMDAEDVHVQVQLLRNASLGDFLDAAHDNLEHARDAGYISKDMFATAWRGAQTDFAPLAKRGLKKGDQIVYRAVVDALQTKVLHGSTVLLDTTSKDPAARRAMIASYFAPGTDFRKQLTKSLF